MLSFCTISSFLHNTYYSVNFIMPHRSFENCTCPADTIQDCNKYLRGLAFTNLASRSTTTPTTTTITTTSHCCIC